MERKIMKAKKIMTKLRPKKLRRKAKLKLLKSLLKTMLVIDALLS